METSLKELINTWRSLTNKSEQYSFYLHSIRPVIVNHLKQHIEAKQHDGIIPVYTTLACIVGYDPNPSLILVGALQPKTCIAFYSQNNARSFFDVFVPIVTGEVPKTTIVPVELPYTNHFRTYKIIEDCLKEYKKQKAVLCDITSGKKIQSHFLGIVAQNYNLDICYIDTDEYIPGTPIPVPGSESLYIHSPKNSSIEQITFTKTPTIAINYIPNQHALLFNVDSAYHPYQFINNELSDTGIETIKKEIEKYAVTINNNIQKQLTYENQLNEIATYINSLLFVPQLYDVLHSISHCMLYIDSHVAGIPWEIALNRIYNIQLPIPRLIFKNSGDSRKNVRQFDKEGMLLIIGAHHGIENFSCTVHEILSTNLQKAAKVTIVEAKDKSTVLKELGKRPYSVILYYGHSQCNDSHETTGWLCHNGDIFNSKKLQVLKDKPPDILISNSCQSAFFSPFANHSIAFDALNAGINTFIGAQFNLEFDKSKVFINTFLDAYYTKRLMPSVSFAAALNQLMNTYGNNDISLYNYVYYGR